MKTSSLSFGMIGGGERARAHSLALKNLGFSRKVICDARESVAIRHAEDMDYADAVTDYRRILDRDDIDAVGIVLPHHIAGEVVLDALQSGKHVLTEKPLCNSVALGREIVKESKRSGKVCMVSHNYRFWPCVRAVEQAVRSGKIGEVFLAQGTLISGPTYISQRPEYRTRNEGNPSTVVLGNGVHGFDMLRFWLGDALSVSAVFRHVISRKVGGTGEDTAACRMEFKQGALAQFTISDGDVSCAADSWQFDLYGTEGVIRWPDAVLLPRHPECYEPWYAERKPVQPVALVSPQALAAATPPLEAIYPHLADVIGGHASSCLEVEEALKSLELTLGAVDSAYDGGKTVAL